MTQLNPKMDAIRRFNSSHVALVWLDTTTSKTEKLEMAYLCVVDHVDSLIDDALGVLAEELENVLNLSFVWQTAEPDAVLASAGRDHLLR